MDSRIHRESSTLFRPCHPRAKTPAWIYEETRSNGSQYHERAGPRASQNGEAMKTPCHCSLALDSYQHLGQNRSITLAAYSIQQMMKCKARVDTVPAWPHDAKMLLCCLLSKLLFSPNKWQVLRCLADGCLIPILRYVHLCQCDECLLVKDVLTSHYHRHSCFC